MNDALLFFDGITLLLIVKILIVTLLLVYGVFALLMMKQISAMTKAVTMRDDFLIRMLGVLNFGFAMVVLVISLVML